MAELGREFERRADAKYRESVQRFFREPVELAGVPTPVFRKIESEFYQRVRGLPKAPLFKLCDELLAVGRMEETGIAFAWAWRRRRELGPSDFRVFERWVRQHVTNWGACDSLCCRALGDLLVRFPALAPKVLVWTGSRGRWVKRASAVALIPGVRKGMFLDQALATAERLLLDPDDMVQKGYGWLLKVVADRDRPRVFAYVMSKRATMPRTALRYAIEKMPAEMRSKAMERARE